MSRIQNIFHKLKTLIQYLDRDLWKIPLKDLSPRKTFLIKQLRIIMLAFRGFSEDELQVRASALTYYTLLAIVPVVAMGFGIAKGFGLEMFLERQLREVFTGRDEIFNWIMNFSHSMLETTHGGIMAGVGLIVLLYTIIIVLIYIEDSFNSIWQIKQSRTISRRVSDYFAIMFVGPLFLILSSAATVFLSTQLSDFAQLQILGPMVRFGISMVPYLLIWIVFAIVYMVMPNTKVRIGSAVVGAVIAGTLFILAQWIYINFQVGVSQYNAIYGSFAALPLLLIWIRLSWLIVLFGAEICFANQNVEHYEFEYEAKNISSYNKKVLAIYMYHLMAKRFEEGQPPLTPPQISNALEIPIKFVRELIDDLMEVRLVSETRSDHSKEHSYQPASDINKVTIRTVVDKLDHKGMDVLIAKQTDELDTLMKTLAGFSSALASSPQNKPVKDI